MLCQAPAANSYAVAAVRNGGSRRLTVSARPLQVDDSRRWCLDSRSPGLRLAADIARDQALIGDLMPDAGTLARLGQEFAWPAAAGDANGEVDNACWGQNGRLLSLP